MIKEGIPEFVDFIMKFKQECGDNVEFIESDAIAYDKGFELMSALTNLMNANYGDDPLFQDSIMNDVDENDKYSYNFHKAISDLSFFIFPHGVKTVADFVICFAILNDAHFIEVYNGLIQRDGLDGDQLSGLIEVQNAQSDEWPI